MDTGTGLVLSSSQVTIAGAGTFSNNGGIGINAGLNSVLAISAWGGIVDISNDTNFGINLDRSVMNIFGNMTINNTKADPGGNLPNGFGINEFGGANTPSK